MRITPSPQLVRTVVFALTKSLRFHLYGTDHLRQAGRASPTGTFFVTHWHQSLLTILGPHHHLPIATLSSRSRDGGIMAAYLETIGIKVVRGSSSKGGAAGAKELIRALREGYHAVLNVDGPRGPFKEVKDGSIELARRCGVPILPLAARASRELSFKRSWDRFRVPLPGAHVAVVYGEPIVFPPGEPSADEILARRRMLATRLHDLEAQASRLVGRGDAYPPRRFLSWLRRAPPAAPAAPAATAPLAAVQPAALSTPASPGANP